LQGVPQQRGGIECGGFVLSFAQSIFNSGKVEGALSARIATTGFEKYKLDLHDSITRSAHYNQPGKRNMLHSQVWSS
jgi:hypothetical protein